MDKVEMKETIKNLYKKKQEVEELNKKTAQLQEEMRQIEEEKKEIGNKESGFYTDLEAEKTEKNQQFITLLNERLRKEENARNAVAKAKMDIIQELQEKLNKIDSNRHQVIEENIEDLQEEKEKIEKQLKLNEITREEFDGLSDEEKQEVRTAKERYLINKNRLNEIAPKIEILSLLHGKSPKDRYKEISQLITEINESFTYENIENLYEEEKDIQPVEELNETDEKDVSSVNISDTVKENPTESNIPKEDSEIVKKQKDLLKQTREMKEKMQKPSPKVEHAPINPILTVDKKPEKTVTVGSGKGSVTFTPKELENFQSKGKENEKDGLEYIDINQETNVNSELNNAVRILYSAKTDKYIITNIHTKDTKVVERSKLEKLDKTLLVEKMGDATQDLTNVDTNVLQLLIAYDKEYKTTKASDYYNMMVQLGKSKKDRQQEMKENQIEIEYNLKGLYNKYEAELYEYKSNFSKEDRQELLRIANNAKQKGIATVKKGIKVRLGELFDNITRKFTLHHLLPTKKVKQISEKAEENLPTQELEKQQRVNQEYIDSLSKQWDKELEKVKNQMDKDKEEQEIYLQMRQAVENREEQEADEKKAKELKQEKGMSIQEGLKKYIAAEISLEEQERQAKLQQTLRDMNKKQPNKNQHYEIGKDGNPVLVQNSENGREPADE